MSDIPKAGSWAPVVSHEAQSPVVDRLIRLRGMLQVLLDQNQKSLEEARLRAIRQKLGGGR